VGWIFADGKRLMLVNLPYNVSCQPDGASSALAVHREQQNWSLTPLKSIIA
jgi:hypothetical protein